MADYTIGELARVTGVTVRTIRYYIALGLLPPPDASGPAASYGEEHRERLELILRLKGERLSLEEIAALLPGLDRDAIQELLAKSPPAPDSAKAYLRQVLGALDEPTDRLVDQVAQFARPAPPPSAPSTRADALPSFSRAPLDLTAAEPTEEWRRYRLHPDLELHVRQPVRDPRLRARLGQLIAAMRRLIALGSHQEEQDHDER